MKCCHERTKDLRTVGFTGPVSTDENRAAHGGVTVTVECCDCGARRLENHNQRWVEFGAWGPSRAEREEHVRQLRRALPPLPPAVTLTRRDGATASLTPTEEGYLIVCSEDVSQDEHSALPYVYPHLEALVAYRHAVRELQRAEGEL